MRSKLFLILINLFGVYAAAYGMLAGGRPNAISDGNNAFAGVVNPANAVWIADRIDIGAYWVYQKSSLNNKDSNPFFPLGKTDLTYKCRNLFNADFAVHKHVNFCEKVCDSSVSLAIYTVPSNLELRTKVPFRLAGRTPISIRNKTHVISAVFSLKLSSSHSIGASIDYFYLTHLRKGFQNSDNPFRSVSPGHVTNNGTDHSNGIGLSLGWRWKITDRLNFGLAWIKKSHCGQFRRYRGYEPHHAKNYIPQSLGGGFSYRISKRMMGRLEVLWTNLGNLPGANNNVLPDGTLNLNKRGSNQSPGPGLQDATFINMGLGYKVNEWLALGAGYSHRMRTGKNRNFLSHSYKRQTLYDLIAFGSHLNYKKHELFMVFTYSFKNRVSGLMPIQAGGGRFVSEKQNLSFSLSWGYRY